jgi:gas vesicle protein
MNKQETNDTAKIFGTLFAGVAIGIGLGLLFAPDKGEETRKKILRTLTDLLDCGDEAKSTSDNLKNEDPEQNHPV